jgi:hypothetical protein
VGYSITMFSRVRQPARLRPALPPFNRRSRPWLPLRLRREEE